MRHRENRGVFVGIAVGLALCASYVVVVLVVMLWPSVARGQIHHVHQRALASHVVVPQSRSFAMTGADGIRITGVQVGVVILQQTATTTMTISLSNPTGRRLEAEMIVPVPDGAVVRSFTFQGTGSEPVAEILPKDEAKKIYAQIVAKIKDPALLEFLGYNMVRSSVFPVEAGGTQKVQLTYEHLLPADGDRIDYVLPRTESLDYTVPWDVSVRVKSNRPISTVYSPSHKIDTTRAGANVVSARIAPDARTDPGSFRLSYLVERNGVTASMLAYPDLKIGGGYFLLLAGLPAELPKAADGTPAIKREVILVLDRSGSMNGEKLEQVREAALQVIAALSPGEAFNIIVYNEAVECFSDRPVPKTERTMAAARAYIKGILASGGTNIHDALLEALRQKPSKGVLPMVLFLTDGLPTVGQTSEVVIRNVAMKANLYDRRIFTFGVGVDVNTPLLDRIASETRASSTYVMPREDVEVKVSQVFKRLSGPVLADAKFEVRDASGGPAIGAVQDIIPGRLPDLFEGDQLVLLGKYIGTSPQLTFVVSGNYLGRERRFRFTFDFDKATTQNAFVPRLWASRKIGVLIDAIRQLGADGGGKPATVDPKTDPRLKELVDEIVRLSTEFGILTEYTAFLAREGTDLSKRDVVMREALRNFQGRAMSTRSGLAAYNQSANLDYQNWQQELNARNRFYDAQMNRVTVTAVQQINDRAFYQRGNRWIDSRVINNEKLMKIDRVVEIGSPEFLELAERLAKEGRAGTISLKGEILLRDQGETVLAK
ncbi:MAG TPA: VIT domain-containing protein [Planctomycetota bacterium]|nr:VIT domain-containing protein [Planctomycetota bacterium]